MVSHYIKKKPEEYLKRGPQKYDRITTETKNNIRKEFDFGVQKNKISARYGISLLFINRILNEPI